VGLVALVLVIWVLTEVFGHDDTVVVGETTVTFDTVPAYHSLAARAA
jgi:hypothetical protein